MKNLFKRKKDPSHSHSSASSSTSTLEISGPFNVRLEHHVDFDREFGLSGVPKDWDLSNIQGISYTVDDVNSEQVLDRSMSEPVMVSTSTTSNNLNSSSSNNNTSGGGSGSVATPSITYYTYKYSY